MIPYGRQNISKNDIDKVLEVLTSDFLTQGPTIKLFEQSIANKTGVNHAVAVSNATAALHLACLALDLGPGDILWTSPITFVASANCGRYCGAEVDFVDIEPDTFNMCPKALEEKLRLAELNGNLPKVIVPVHMCGQSPDMAKLAKLARAYDIRIIEDASHAIGAEYAGYPVGCCQYSDITIFSFHPVKIITTGEGGMAVTNDVEIAKRIERLRSHGITRDEELMTNESHGLWYYQQLELGFNYRMTDIQAALGLSQLERLDEFVSRRAIISDLYDDLLSSLPMRIPGRINDAKSAWHLYVVRLDNASKHTSVFNGLRSRGIGVNLHYIPVHLQPYYRKLGFKHGDFRVAEDYYSRAISLPIYPGLGEDEQMHIFKACEEILVSD